MVLSEGVRPEDVLQRLVSNPELTVERYERVEISLDDIFVQVVGGEKLNDSGEEAV